MWAETVQKQILRWNKLSFFNVKQKKVIFFPPFLTVGQTKLLKQLISVHSENTSSKLQSFTGWKALTNVVLHNSVCKTHNHWGRRGRLAGRAGVLQVHLAVQNVLFDHLEFTVLDRYIAVFKGNEKGIFILAIEPLLGLQSRIGSSRVWVQVVLEQVRLKTEDRVVRWGNCGRRIVTAGIIRLLWFNRQLRVFFPWGWGLTFLGTVITMGSHFLSCSLKNLITKTEKLFMSQHIYNR